jgi:hypothetical protein
MQVRTHFPDKKDFPIELQRFYLDNHKQFNNFNGHFKSVCFLIVENDINSKYGIFSGYNGKRPDQVHYSIALGLGFIEEKSTNYGISRIEKQFSEFKTYFESRFSDSRLCTVKYFILYANIFSENLRKVLKINKSDNSLIYLSGKNKQYKIDGIPVYFFKKR